MLSLVGIGLFLALTWLATSHLICPSRRLLQDYHHEILDHPNDHGLKIDSFTLRDHRGYDVPCLLCEPGKLPGPALKGNKLRAELQSQGYALPSWGAIKATIILLHGHSGRKEDHLPVAERFCALGFRCILIDLPGHGDNPAPYATFGYFESTLPSEVLREAEKRFQLAKAPSAIFGISQGGAIALQAAALPEANWFAVAELSSFASLDEVISEQAKNYFEPLQGPAQKVVHWLVATRAGFNPTLVKPLDAALHLDRPAVLIGHGDADTFIPVSHAQRLYDAVPSSQKRYLSIPGAGHHNVLITATPVYATVGKFLLNSIPR